MPGHRYGAKALTRGVAADAKAIVEDLVQLVERVERKKDDFKEGEIHHLATFGDLCLGMTYAMVVVAVSCAADETREWQSFMSVHSQTEHLLQLADVKQLSEPSVTDLLYALGQVD